MRRVRRARCVMSLDAVDCRFERLIVAQAVRDIFDIPNSNGPMAQEEPVRCPSTGRFFASPVPMGNYGN